MPLRIERAAAALVLAACAAALIDASLHVALAQGAPFGLRAPAPAQPDGFFAWLLAKQAEFEKAAMLRDRIIILEKYMLSL